MSAETDFLDNWNSKYKKKAESQFRPQKKIYLSEKSDLNYRQWLNQNSLKDYRADFTLHIKRGWIRGITVEFDGQGFGHSGAQAERDRQKINQFLKLGYPTMRFSVITLKSNFNYVEDEIKDVYKLITGKEIEQISGTY